MLREALVAVSIVASGLVAFVPLDAAADLSAYSVELETGETATGYLALPASPGSATHLVVFLKGTQHTAFHYLPYLADVADAGAIGVALHYADFEARFAGDAAKAAALDILTDYPSVTTVVLFGVSGGLPGATWALATAPPKPAGGPLFDYLFDVEGVSNLVETYAEARAAFAAVPAAGEAVGEIEAECGTPAAAHCLALRSAVVRAPEMKLKGLKGAFLVHSVNDGLVPYNQAAEFAAALTAVGIPTDTSTVLRGVYPDDKDTALTEYATGPPGGPDVDLAGHATESYPTHPVVAIAHARLHSLLAGSYVPGMAGAQVYDRDVGTVA